MKTANKNTLMPAILAGLMTAGTVGAQAQEAMGAIQDEYMNSCAVCHGESGRGDGNLVNFLTLKPIDLTKMTENNHGTFPFLEVFQVVDGRSLVSGHGTRDMPVWGRRYQEEVGEAYGPYGGEAAVRARVLELVYYIQSIQQ